MPTSSAQSVWGTPPIQTKSQRVAKVCSTPDRRLATAIFCRIASPSSAVTSELVSTRTFGAAEMRSRVRDIKVRRNGGSDGSSLLPVILKPAIEPAAAQGGDGVGAAHRPEHARSFQAGSDHGLAASFHHARTNEESFGAKPRIVHPAGVGGEEVRF